MYIRRILRSINFLYVHLDFHTQLVCVKYNAPDCCIESAVRDNIQRNVLTEVKPSVQFVLLGLVFS